ncbi:MAG: COX15/CtaA family protein [Candidatus Thiodiazotropha sp. (ex Myrtea sp. 'scaly one' KF741663)]|nr:COX15/CtaA family protein [Candidatus Thiodiazotropha sp. (ex Myrtea sp. 'scaly one' KF741663)]
MPLTNPQVSRSRQYRLAIFTCLLAFSVVLVGAYVRLSDAGLGCPDWPGCYGELVVPAQATTSQQDNADYSRPLHVGKAWKEMIHRYLAGSLGIFILSLTILAWLNRKSTAQPLLLPTLLLLLVILQAALGMWTVTLLVKPAIVTAHLLGGFATFVLLWLLALRLRPVDSFHTLSTSQPTRRLILLSLFVLIIQITLGGWTSTNYAALGCSEFPACYDGQWWPDMDFKEAFVIWRGLGVNYEFGVLENDARSAIHMTHRIGALATLITLGLLAIWLLRKKETTHLRRLGGLLGLLLLMQVALGITNVLGHLPLPVAVAHNGGAALLLATLVTLIWISRRHE